jgi:hypothetical protein
MLSSVRSKNNPSVCASGFGTAATITSTFSGVLSFRYSWILLRTSAESAAASEAARQRGAAIIQRRKSFNGNLIVD